jgi:hypothetical protein
VNRSLANIDLVGCRPLTADEGLSADPNRMTGSWLTADERVLADSWQTPDERAFQDEPIGVLGVERASPWRAPFPGGGPDG